MARKKPQTPSEKKAAWKAKLSRALRRYWREAKKHPRKEKSRRERISKSLRSWNKKHVTKRERDWGRKLVEAEKKERRKIKAKLSRETKAAGRKRLTWREKVEKHLAAIAAFANALGCESMIDTAVHSDGSFDSELKVSIPRGMSGRRLLLRMAPKMTAPSGTWVSVGWIFSPNRGMTDKELENYEKAMRRMLQVHAHYQRSEKMVTNIAGARNLYTNLEDAGRRKPEWLYLRIHWSADGEKPS